MSLEIKIASQFQELLSPRSIESIVSECSQNEVSVGRGGGGFKRVSDQLEVYSRQSRRGGMFGKVFQRLYFTSSCSFRTHQELSILEFLKKKGFPTSNPVASYVKRFGCIYTSFLLTEKIKGSNNLLVSIKNKEIDFEQLVNICNIVGEQTKKLLYLGIVHKDLHLGNILYQGNTVYIIDFDKAHFLSHPSQYHSSKKKLIERFGRSCQKHRISRDCFNAFIKGVK